MILILDSCKLRTASDEHALPLVSDDHTKIRSQYAVGVERLQIAFRTYPEWAYSNHLERRYISCDQVVHILDLQRKNINAPTRKKGNRNQAQEIAFVQAIKKTRNRQRIIQSLSSCTLHIIELL